MCFDLKEYLSFVCPVGVSGSQSGCHQGLEVFWAVLHHRRTLSEMRQGSSSSPVTASGNPKFPSNSFHCQNWEVILSANKLQLFNASK